MQFSIVVRVVVEEPPSQALPGIRVTLYDRAQMSPNDLLSTTVTDEGGEGRFEFQSDEYLGSDDPVRSFPFLDLYVVVYSSNNDVVLSTRPQVDENTVPPQVVVPVPRELIAKYRLFPNKERRSTQEKQKAWVDYWRKRAKKDKGPGTVIDLCLTRTILDILAGLNAPRTQLQREATRQMKNKVSLKDQDWIRTKAIEARDSIDSMGLLGKTCSSATPKDIASMLISAGGPLSTLYQALVEVEPSPQTQAGPVTAGQGHSQVYAWDAKCIYYYNRGMLTGAPKQDMDHYYDPAHDLIVLDPPHVKEIDIYENALKHTIRKAYNDTKSLDLWILDVEEGLHQDHLAMAVDQSSADYLVDKRDPADDKQILVIDVVPAQTVTIKGEGFISEKAYVDVRFGEWVDQNAEVLKPRPLQATAFWSQNLRQIEVHGSNFDGNDWIVFDWPPEASVPGLYQIEIRFDNPNKKLIATQPAQDYSTCETGFTLEGQTQSLYFAVLPALQPHPVRLNASKVECLRLTKPRFWPDDIAYTGAIQFNHFVYDTSQPQLTMSVVSSDGWDKGDEVRWENQAFVPAHPSILPRNEITHLLDFQANSTDVMAITMNASEIDGDFDRRWITILAIAVLIAVAVLVITIIVGIGVIIAVIAVILAILSAIFSGGFSFAAMGAVLGADATICGALIAAVIGVLTIAAPATIAAISALIQGQDTIAEATIFITAPDIPLLLSPVRFHHRVWRSQRKMLGDVQVTTQSDPQGFHEQYEGHNLGGSYKMFLDILP